MALNAEALVSLSWSINLWQAGGCAFVFYDHVTNIDREVEFIWSEKWTLATALYLVTRYAGDASFLHASFNLWATGKELDMLCRSSFQVQSWLGMVSMLAMNAIMIKRVACMYGGDPRVQWVLAVVFLALSIYSVVLTVLMVNLPSVVTRIQGLYLFEVCHVVPGSVPSWYWTFLCFILIFEALVFALSLFQGICFVREERQMRRITGSNITIPAHIWETRRSVANVLLRDSILFPLLNVIFAMLNIIIWSTHASLTLAHAVRVISAAAVPTLGCRLLLNLRGAYHRPFRDEYYNQSLLAADSS